MKQIKNIFERSANISFPNTIHEWLLISSFFSCLLLLIRVVVTGFITFCFLGWNLFLAFIPYWITLWAVKNPSIVKNKFKLTAIIALWLLFVPNSFYIVTDLFHLYHYNAAPKWFDVLMIFSFAWNGILCGIISIQRVEMIFLWKRKKNFSLLLVFLVMWLSAFGVYIGRILRFNSWDVITNPFSLVSDILDMVVHPFANFYSLGMTFCYAVFMTLLYYSIKKLNESFTIQNN